MPGSPMLPLWGGWGIGGCGGPCVSCGLGRKGRDKAGTKLGLSSVQQGAGRPCPRGSTGPGGNLLHLSPRGQDGAEGKDSAGSGTAWDILDWIYKLF